MSAAFDLKDSEYRKISSAVYDTARINLLEGKKDLVQGRLSKRIRTLGLSGFSEYLKLVDKDPEEFTAMVNCLCTNTTTFFREQNHFDFLKETFYGELHNNGSHRVRLWSAGCSSGEEPYSIAMHMKEHFQDVERRDCLILATDISTRALQKAREGAYHADRLANVPRHLIPSYFSRDNGSFGNVYRVNPEIKAMIKFRSLNLFGQWPMKGGFDAIFCRNVMIYFNKETQQELVSRFYNALRPGGYLIIGHSESLIGIEHDFRFVKPTIYRREN